MDKKKLKILDIHDLESDHSSSSSNPDEEESIVGKVNLSDLDHKAPSVTVKPKENFKRVQGEIDKRKIDSSILKNDRFKKYEGSGSQASVVKFMTQKYRFDKRVFVEYRVIIFILLVVMSAAVKINYNDVLDFEASIGFFRTPVDSILFDVVRIFRQFYLVIIIGFLYLQPLKRNTNNLVEIFYDGLHVPSEIFGLGRSKRKRVLWAEIVKIDYQNRYNTPFVQLFNKKDELLGEIRLDFDQMDFFYEILDRYCPQSHPLRNLFNNSQKS